MQKSLPSKIDPMAVVWWQRWRRDALNASTEMPATIRTDSGPFHNDERRTFLSKKSKNTFLKYYFIKVK